MFSILIFGMEGGRIATSRIEMQGIDVYSSTNAIELGIQKPLKPFLRWAGGKRRIVKRLYQCLPDDIHERIYREPFVGAGALYFFLRPKRAVLSDFNDQLIRCYMLVRQEPDLIARYLKKHVKNTCRDYYYRIREIYNQGNHSVAQAARFIYLNQTCFNGIFRVNKRDKFNVPYGRKEPPCIPTVEHLCGVASALQSAEIISTSYIEVMKSVNQTDFFYLDPPYPPLNGTSLFTHYTSDRFSIHDQVKLASAVRHLDEHGALFMMTNADTTQIREIYKGFQFLRFSVPRWITCKHKKHRVVDLLITNYRVPSEGVKAIANT